MWNSILQIVVLYSVFAALIELAIRLATKLGFYSTQYTFFVASTGIGMVIGAAFVATNGSRLDSKSLPLIGFMIMALVLALLIFVPNLPSSLILCVFLGMGGAFVNIPMQTTIQQQTPPSMHGKVFGFQNHAVNIALSAPLLITTRLANAYGLQSVLLGMSIIVAAIGIWSWRAVKPN
ncbi:major facilitator superfamily protein [Calothrix sp. NIES-4071]|nr:major facilitator superfamily protein [Calothrix sp. NIES-4071]BAZ61316.1 major facilitator superfamily protein [Calothrix sp. NIES-4105]